MTLELFLNLTWLFIAAAATVRFALWSNGQTRKRQRVVCLAMICAIALLFPIISVTDDLHSDAAVLEETSTIRRAAAVVHDAFVAVVIDTLLPIDASHAVAVVLSPQIAASARLLDGVRTPAGVRPPPVFSA